MKKIIWQLQPLSLPAAERSCKKCGQKSAFLCSGQFRINAQKKQLDIWLIYRCARCDTTWNSAIFSRVTPQSLPGGLLEGFFCNDPALAWRYAADAALLQKNGARLLLPEFTIEGEAFSLTQEVELTIKSAFPLPVKVSSLVRQKLSLSQKFFSELADSGRLTSVPAQQLNKCKLQSGIRLVFSPNPASPESCPASQEDAFPPAHSVNP